MGGKECLAKVWKGCHGKSMIRLVGSGFGAQLWLVRLRLGKDGSGAEVMAWRLVFRCVEVSSVGFRSGSPVKSGRGLSRYGLLSFVAAMQGRFWQSG